MRSSKSRSRSKSNRNRSVGNIVNRVFDSSGPEGKVRGTPQQIIEKYNQLTRDAQLSNDRVAAENFQQHSEHYTRMLGEAQHEADVRREQQEAQNRERQQQRDQERVERDEVRAAAPPTQPQAQNQPQFQAQAHSSQQPRPQAVAPAAVDEIIASHPADAPQPDVIDMPIQAADTGLVDTPESKPKRPRKPRVAKAKVENAEPREKPARRVKAEETEKPRAVDDKPAAPEQDEVVEKPDAPEAAE